MTSHHWLELNCVNVYILQDSRLWTCKEVTKVSFSFFFEIHVSTITWSTIFIIDHSSTHCHFIRTFSEFKFAAFLFHEIGYLIKQNTLKFNNFSSVDSLHTTWHGFWWWNWLVVLESYMGARRRHILQRTVFCSVSDFSFTNHMQMTEVAPIVGTSFTHKSSCVSFKLHHVVMLPSLVQPVDWHVLLAQRHQVN